MTNKLVFLLSSLFLLGCSHASQHVREVQDSIRSEVMITVTNRAVFVVTDPQTKKTDLKLERTANIGTGVVTDVIADRSVVLTANHVVDMPDLSELPDDMRLVKLTREIEVKGVTGAICSGDVVAQDTKNDLAAILVSCVVAETSRLARELPETGTEVNLVGAAMGVNFIAVTGIYLYTDADDDIVSSAPTASGMSGAALYCHGEVIGIFKSRNRGFEHISYATQLKYLITFRESYLKKLQSGVQVR